VLLFFLIFSLVCRESERLIQNNLHPQLVISGLRVATQAALAALEAR
jgi:chaperonin GroEL (HSP60 family)